MLSIRIFSHRLPNRRHVGGVAIHDTTANTLICRQCPNPPRMTAKEARDDAKAYKADLLTAHKAQATLF